MSFLLPPRLENEQGHVRTVGFELEFGGVQLTESADILKTLFGGEIIRDGEYVYRVASPLGDFQVEADSAFLKEKRHEKYLKALGVTSPDSRLAHGVTDALSHLAGTLIPFEIIMPPLKITELDAVERVREQLQKHSAKGTRSSVFMAFGMQFNPEIPDKSAETILAYLRAFFLLFDWLYEESDIPLSRRLAPFIHDFPTAYVRLVLDPAYAPDRGRLMDDYLTHNPTRNRPLDMLPLFSDIDKVRVFSHPIERDLVKSRPTFHYRLPNSQVDDPAWTIASDWNKWIEVERLAGDHDRLTRMSEDYARVHDDTLFFTRAKWVERTREWLNG